MLHNGVKVAAWTFLLMAKRSRRLWSTAAQVAQAAGTTPASMYVLCNRWLRWRYIDLMDAETPRAYGLSQRGVKRLACAPRWYAGDLRQLRLDTAARAGLTLWWGHRTIPGGQVFDRLYTLQAPGQSDDDFSQVEIPGGRSTGLLPPPSCLLFLAAEGVEDALAKFQALTGVEPSRVVLEKMVALGVARWKA